jgi:hypothetical protein
MNAFGSRASSGDAARKRSLLSRRSFAVLALFLGLSLVLGTPVLREHVAKAAPAIMQVFVVNDTRNPVPVHEQGTADVNVTNVPLGVHLTNVPLAVRVTGETPVQRQLQLDFGGNQIASDTYIVPANKRLRIELVTYDQFDSLLELNKFLVTTTVDSQKVIHSLKISRLDSSVDAVTEPVLIYADPGTKVEFEVVLSGLSSKKCPGSFTFVPNCSGSFSGVLIDVP